MKKRSKLRKGLAILLSLAMVVGLVPGVGTMKVSAEESSATEETGTAAGITYTPLDGNPEGNNSSYGDERYPKLLDGTADTKWCCNFKNPSYVIFKTSEPVYVKGYSIWTANDTASESGRNPVAWTLSGCNDYNETDKTGGTWVTIHEVTGAKTEDALPVANKTEKSYSFAESEYSYKYFKLNITKIKEGSTMQLGDFSLTYNACEHQWVKTGDTIAPTCTEGGYDEEKCSLCLATRNVANSVSATGHNWATGEEVKPTCTEEGYTPQTCSVCNATQRINIQPALGHSFGENGQCTRCSASDTAPSQPNGEGTAEKPYRISTAGELLWFAGLVNNTLDRVTQDTSVYAVLALDIEFGSNFVSIGTETYPFSGTFDGGGHTITVNQSESTDVALFGFLGNSTVKNLTVTGKIATTTTSKFAAGIAMQTKSGTTATVENCISDVTIESSIVGDGTHAGLLGVPNGAVNINNCAFTGAINGSSTNSCGGMIGYAKGTVKINNSYIAATFNLDDTSCHTFSRNFAQYVTLDNCYYLNALGDVPSGATKLTEKQFSNGEAAYFLQGEQTVTVWGQNIDNNQTKQYYPVLGGAEVYKNITYQCPGSNIVVKTEYSNTKKAAAYGEHAMQKVKAKAATCTEAGNIEHWVCSYGEGVYYKDENRTEKYETVVIPATGHTWGTGALVAPTCTEEGYTPKICSVCNAEQKISIVPALEHNIGSDGVCSRCGNNVPYLSCDSDGKNWATSTCPRAFLVKADDTEWGTSNTESWYVASGTVTIGSRVTVNGTVHLILADNCNLTINGGIGVTEGNNFTIYAQSDGNKMGCLTIQNVSVYNAGIGGTNSISGKITINGGIVSTLSGSSGAAAIGGGRSFYGEVTINGGQVTAIGDDTGAGIGHGSKAPGISGGVVINGGVVTASSSHGAGIGGGYGGKAKVTIKGGVITATSGKNAGIGGYYGDDTVTITGSPVIFASSISDQSGKESNTWSGIIFEGNTGKVYGTSATVDEDCIIPGGKILEVVKEQTISIADNKTLTNEGIIYNNGTFTGAVTNSGTIHNTGTISGELDGTVYHYTVEPAENSNCQSVGLALKAADTAFEGTVTYALADSVTNVVIENESTLKVTDRDEIKDTIPVTATFTVDNVIMTKTGNISIPDHNFPAAFDADGFKQCSVCGKVIYQSAEVVSDTHYPELKGNYAGYYAIENAGQLYWFAGLVNNGGAGACAKLMTDITVNEDVLMADGTVNTEKISSFRSWTPIGNPANSYTGIFDGDNHTISGLYFDDVNSDYVGLFGYVVGPQGYEGPDGIISNVGIVDSYFNGKDNVGGISGYNGEKIINCYNLGTINGTNNVGGISGHNDGTINNCHNTGNIKGNQYVGGVSGGNNSHYGGCISNCYNLGTINGTDNVGGVCGGNFCITVNCYNAGTVTATGENAGVGGVCGYSENDITKNCYYIDEQETDKIEGTIFKEGEQFVSGEVAYLLAQDFTIYENNIDGSVWRQKLGENGDAYPVLKKTGDEGNTVYRNETYAGCEGNKGEPVYSYSNTQEDTVYAEHTIGEGGICSSCNQKIKYKVSLTSTVDGTEEEDTVALLTGGGLYTIGTEATVTAPKKDGFTFKGWYHSGYVAEDEPRSEKLSYTFTPEADTSLVAVYVANASIMLNVSGERDAYSVNGTTQTSNSFTQSFKAGSSITVAYTGSGTFCYWKNDSGNIVSRDGEYTFTLVSDTSLTAVAVGNSAGSEESGYSTLIEFVSYYGQIMQAATWNSKDDASGKTLPAAPSKLGGTFKYWSLDGTNEATAATILAAINENTTRITVVPVYEEITTTYSITVKYPSDSNKVDVVYHNQKLGNTLTVTADSIEGKEFAYWSGDAEGSTKLSYSQSYFLLVSGDTTLYPIYSDTVVEEQPVVAITNVSKNTVDSKNKLSFEVTRSVSAKYELVEQGVIYSVSDTYATDKTAMVIGAGSVYKFVSSDTANNGVFIANMNVTGHEASKLYVKGYVIVKNTETGNTEIIYTDMSAKSYNDLAQN